MTPIEEIYTFLCDIYAERDFYSRCKLIDMFRDKIK